MKFIITVTLTYIPYAVLWFLWHNNIFPEIYYAPSTVLSIYGKDSLNIWAINFANALFVFGFVYFYFKSVKPDASLISSILWGVYYTISVMGFFAFMNYGIVREWNSTILAYDLGWAAVGGILIGDLVFILYNKLGKNNS